MHTQTTPIIPYVAPSLRNRFIQSLQCNLQPFHEHDVMRQVAVQIFQLLCAILDKAAPEKKKDQGIISYIP